MAYRRRLDACAAFTSAANSVHGVPRRCGSGRIRAECRRRDRRHRGCARASLATRRSRSHMRRPLSRPNTSAQPGRPALQIVERLLVRRDGVGMIDPRHDLPRLGRPAGHRLCAFGARVQRLDAQAVIGLLDEPLVEIGAFERSFGQFPPAAPHPTAEIRSREGEYRRTCTALPFLIGKGRAAPRSVRQFPDTRRRPPCAPSP